MKPGSRDLVEFLRARLAEDEGIARGRLHHMRPRGLAEVEAKLAILDTWQRENAGRSSNAEEEARAWLMDEVVGLLAQPYREHPAFDPAWRM